MPWALATKKSLLDKAEQVGSHGWPMICNGSQPVSLVDSDWRSPTLGGQNRNPCRSSWVSILETIGLSICLLDHHGVLYVTHSARRPLKHFWTQISTGGSQKVSLSSRRMTAWPASCKSSLALAALFDNFIETTKDNFHFQSPIWHRRLWRCHFSSTRLALLHWHSHGLQSTPTLWHRKLWIWQLRSSSSLSYGAGTAMAFRINRFHNPGWILALTLATKTYRSRSVCINKFQHPGWIPEI